MKTKIKNIITRLIKETSMEGFCFMKLVDVQKKYPKFRSKRIFIGLDTAGNSTGVEYVRGVEVKSIINDTQWYKIPSVVLKEWLTQK